MDGVTEQPNRMGQQRQNEFDPAGERQTYRRPADRPMRRAAVLLWALLQGESSVACLAELVGTSPTVVSQHLSKLRLAKLVQARKEGTFAFYSAADDHVARLLAEALFHADHQVQGLPDHPASRARSPRERQT